MAGLLELLAIPTVSADPGATADLRRGAAVVARRLRSAGCRTLVVTRAMRPVAVVGQRPGRPGAAPVLLYAHLDTQPPSAGSAWPPAPVVRGGRVHARGASDDKGPLHAILLALERTAGDAHRVAPILAVIDAEEEIGSPHLGALLRRLDLQRIATALLFDSPGGPNGEPAIVTAYRGVIGARLTVRSSSPEVHAGRASRAVPDAGAVLARVLARLDAEVRPQGGALRVTRLAAGPPAIPGRGGWALAPAAVVPIALGEIDVRLPSGLDPHRVAARLSRLAHRARSTTGLEIDIDTRKVVAGVRLDRRHGEGVAGQAIRRVWGRAPVADASGGSLPVARLLHDLGIRVVSLGLTAAGDGAHGPSESTEVGRVARIARTVEVLLRRVAA
jgi:acetylornithine deacetylase/succinyl-diaminopimelate desuccinylase-like protein